LTASLILLAALRQVAALQQGGDAGEIDSLIEDIRVAPFAVAAAAAY
jgi:hypothetical protein